LFKEHFIATKDKMTQLIYTSVPIYAIWYTQSWAFNNIMVLYPHLSKPGGTKTVKAKENTRIVWQGEQ